MLRAGFSGGKGISRRLSEWNARTFQLVLGYKLGGLGSRPGTLTHPIPPGHAPSVIPWQPIGAD
nr:hypothetical protein [Candidatus Freyrarchaeum guaymaensis]